jgi:phage terminase large subunit-like protein
MAPRKSGLTIESIIGEMTQSLRSAADRPSVYGYQPMKHQKKFHESPARGRAFIGGNRSGKTVGGAAECSWWLNGNHPYRKTPEPPVRLRGVASDWPHGMVQIMLPELARWVPPSLLVNGSWEDSFHKGDKVLNLSNGSTMDFTTCEMELVKHAGTSRHGLWFDEEPPRAIFNENMARLVDTGGDWWLTMTPVEGMTWVYDDIFLAAKTNSQFFVLEASMDDNIYLSQGQIEFLLSTMDADEVKARREGKFIQIGGLIYKTFGPHNIIPKIEMDSDEWQAMKKHWTFFCTMDHGFNNPTCWLWCAVDKDGKVIVFDEHYASQMVVSEHAETVRARNAFYGINPLYNVGDPSIANSDPITGTSVQIEYAIAGVPILPGNNDVKIGLNVVARALKDRQLFLTRNCENLIWEMARYRWATWSSKIIAEKRNPKEEPNKKDDHAADALRYGMCSRPEHVEKIVEVLDNMKGIAPSLPMTGERYDHPSKELVSTYSDPHMGGDF